MELLGNIVTVVGFLGIIYSILQWMYYHKIHFFLWVNKSFSWKKDVNFELTILSKTSSYDIDNITKFIRSKTDSESKIVSKSKEKIVFSYDTLLFQVNKDSFDEDGYEIELFIKNSNSTYMSAKKNLHKLGVILDEMIKTDILKPNKYQFVSSFKKKNPFIGPSVSTIQINNIKNYMMILSSNVFSNVTLENDNDIQVGLNNISYVDTNFSEMKLVAEIILAL